MKKKQIIFLHLFYWILNFGFSVILPFVSESAKFIALDLSFFIVSFCVFYINYFFVVPYFFNVKKLYLTVVGFFVSVTCFVLLRYGIEELLLPKMVGHGNYAEGTTLSFYFYDNIYFSSTTIFISTVFGLIYKFFETEKEKLILLEAKKTAELKALKTQINPHFIFNSLNNIYSLVYQNSEKALPALEELGRLLRYSTKDLEKDFIPLDREIGYIESLIELEKLRIKSPELILVSKNVNNALVEISPMLLVPFVENAFKHGDFNGKGFELTIAENDHNIHFRLMNFKKPKMKDLTSGIGIDNVQKRLNLIYPHKHELKITESDDTFVVDLKIDVKK